MVNMDLTRILVPVPSTSVIGTLLEDNSVGIATLSETDGGQDTAKTTANNESPDFGRYRMVAFGKGTGSESVVAEEAELILELLVLIRAILAHALLFLDGILCTESDGVEAELLDGAKASEDGL
jgi:hypothetical protein